MNTKPNPSSKKSKNKKPQQTEFLEQVRFVQWFKLQYKNVILNGSLGGLKLPIGQAVKAKRMGSLRAFPDLFIAKPTKQYAGLFIELKKTGERLTKEDGTYASEHIKEQADMLNRLSAIGYKAVFAIGYDEAVRITKAYLGQSN